MVESKKTSQEEFEKSAQDILDSVKGAKLDSQELDRVLEELITLDKTIPTEDLQGPLRELVRQAVDTTLNKQSFELDQLRKRQKLIDISERMGKAAGASAEKPMDQIKKTESFVKNDPLLRAIFTGTHKRKVAALNKIGTARTTEKIWEQPFYLRDLEHFERVVKESLADSMNVKKEELPENILKLNDFSMWIILNSKDIEKDLKKIKSDLELNLDVYADIKHKSGKKTAEAKPTPETREKPKPPAPSDDKIKESKEQEREREKKEFNEKLIALEKKLNEGNREDFNKWEQLTNAINRSENVLKAALKKRNKKFEYIMGRKPILALMNSFSKAEKGQVSEENIGEKLVQKLAEISKIFEEEKGKLAPKKPAEPIPAKVERGKAEEETKPAPIREPATEPEKTEIEEESLQEKVLRLAPNEFNQWEEVFIRATKEQAAYGISQSVRERVPFSFADSRSIDEAKEALKKAGFTSVAEANNAMDALKKTIGEKPLEESDDIAKIIAEKTEEIKTIVEAEMPHIQARRKQEANQRRQANETKKNQESTAKAQPKPPVVPNLKELIDKQPDEEKAFFEAITAYVTDKPEKLALFIQMMEFLGKDVQGNGDMAALQKKLAKHLRPLRKLNAEALKNEALFENLFNSVSPLKSEMEEALQDQEKLKQETEKQKYLLRMQNQALKAEFSKLFKVINMKPENIDDEDARHNLKEVQEVCQKFLDGIDHKSLKKKDLNERKKDIEEIKKKFKDDVESHIEDLGKIAGLPAGLRPAAPAAADSASSASSPAAGPVAPAVPNLAPAPAIPGTPPPAPLAAVSTTPAAAPMPVPETALTVKEIPGFETETAALLDAAMQNKKAMEALEGKKPDCLTNATYMAINAAIKEAKKKDGFDIKVLIRFLKFPKGEDVEIDEAAVMAEMGPEKKNAKNLTSLIKALKDERTDNKEFLDRFLRRDPTDTEKEKIKDIDDRKPILRRLIEHAELMNQIEQKGLEYTSPRHVLALIQRFLNPDDTAQQINNKLKDGIQAQKENLYSGWRIAIDRIGFILKPSLESTLKALGKDTDFAKDLGDKPGDELAKLAGIFENDPVKVKEWIKALPGGLEKHIHSTIPRLIAYLEIAIRDGKASYLIKTGRTQDLVDNLRAIEDQYLLEETEAEFRKDPNMKKEHKMIHYFEKKYELSRIAKDINKDIIKNNAAKSVGLKGATAVGATAAVVMSPFSILAILPALVSAPAFIASYMKTTPMNDKNKEHMRKASIRALFSNSLALSGAALSAAVFPLSAPLWAAAYGVGAVTGALSPELLKHRKAIYEKSKPVTKYTYQKILPKAFSTAWWTLKLTVGLPATLVYYGLKAKKK